MFYDDHALQFFDPDHSDDEDRFLMLGLSGLARLLVVCHCWRQSASAVRIISVSQERSSLSFRLSLPFISASMRKIGSVPEPRIQMNPMANPRAS